jgi:hypothetical protein
MGHLNKFTLAPGSISDVKSGGRRYKLSPEAEKSLFWWYKYIYKDLLFKMEINRVRIII